MKKGIINQDLLFPTYVGVILGLAYPMANAEAFPRISGGEPQIALGLIVSRKTFPRASGGDSMVSFATIGNNSFSPRQRG